MNNKNKLKNSMKNNNSSGTNGMHNPSSVTAIQLTREHYMVIGNPRGKISDANPNGLSKEQMHTMKSILIYENNENNNNSSNNDNNNNMQGHFESWKNRNNINFSRPNTNIASIIMASSNSPDNNSLLNDSTPLPAISNHETPVRLNIPIEHNYAHFDGVFIDTIDHSNDEPINVFTIKEQRHSNDNESDNESDHGSINEDEIENILSPPYLPYSPPHFNTKMLLILPSTMSILPQLEN